MSNVIPINNNSACLSVEMLLDNAKQRADTMDGAFLVWYEKNTGRKHVEYLSSNLTPQDVNWFLDEIKSLLHANQL